jgi:C4-dicarboxylate-binding protein DctP
MKAIGVSSVLVCNLVLTLGLAAQVNAQQAPIVIKFSHVVTSETPKGRAADFFKKLAEQRTNGRVRIEVYPNSTLFKDKEELEALQLGSVQMLAPSFSKLGPMGINQFEAFDLPYLFNSYDEVHRVTRGPIGASMLRLLRDHGIAGLAFWDNGFKDFTANKPLRTPSDFRGLKIRIQSSRVLDAQMRALGAIPQVTAFSEVYQALQTGVVDGFENPPSNIYTQKVHEVQKYMTLSDHGYVGYVVIVNAKFWDSLLSDLRVILEQSMAEATDFADDIAKKENDDAIEAIRKKGRTQIIELTADEKLALKQVLLPVHHQLEGRVGHDLLESIYAATGRLAGESPAPLDVVR